MFENVLHKLDSHDMTFPSSTFLDVGGVNLGDEDGYKKIVKLLTNALFENKVVLGLNVNNSCIGDEGVKMVSQRVLQSKNALQELSLNSSNVTAKGAGHIVDSLKKKSCTLQSLELSGNTIGDEGVAALATAALQSNSSLRRLTLRDIRISDDGVKAISNSLTTGKNKSLQSLDLASNQMGDEDGAQGIVNVIQNNVHLRV